MGLLWGAVRVVRRRVGRFPDIARRISIHCYAEGLVATLVQTILTIFCALFFSHAKSSSVTTCSSLPFKARGYN